MSLVDRAKAVLDGDPDPGRTTVATQVVDAERGLPAVGLALTLTLPDGDTKSGATDAEGRARVEGDLPAGHYTFTFETGAWYAAQQRETCYPQVSVTVDVAVGERHQTVVALGAFSYSTYRGL